MSDLKVGDLVRIIKTPAYRGLVGLIIKSEFMYINSARTEIFDVFCFEADEEDMITFRRAKNLEKIC